MHQGGHRPVRVDVRRVMGRIHAMSLLIGHLSLRMEPDRRACIRHIRIDTALNPGEQGGSEGGALFVVDAVDGTVEDVGLHLAPYPAVRTATGRAYLADRYPELFHQIEAILEA